MRRQPYRSRTPYHIKSVPYVGFSGGHLALFPPKGAYRLLKTEGFGNAYFGWNFGSYFALELGLGGAAVKDKAGTLGDIDRLGLAGLTLDARIRVVQPSPRNFVVPYFQAGLGLYWMGGRLPEGQGGDCQGRSCVLAHGGGVQAGTGIDFYLSRWAILGMRVLYRHLFMSGLKCLPGTPCAGASRAAGSNLAQLPAVSADLTLTFFWTHL